MRWPAATPTERRKTRHTPPSLHAGDQLRPHEEANNQGKSQGHEQLDRQPHQKTPRLQAGSSDKSSGTSAGPLRVDTTSSSRARGAGALLCNRLNKIASDRCWRGADGTSGRPAAIFSLDARPGPPRLGRCGGVLGRPADGNTPGPLEWGRSLGMRGRRQRCQPPFGTQRSASLFLWGYWGGEEE